MARTSKYNWEAIREAYEGGLDKADICRKYQLPSKLLGNKILTDKWVINKEYHEFYRMTEEAILEIGIEQFSLFVDSFVSGLKYLYVIKMNRHQYYKIGIADNVEHRLATLQTGNPEKLSVIYKKEFAYCYKLEQSLHKEYSKHRMQGEWFSLTNEKKEELLNKLNSIGIFNG